MEQGATSSPRRCVDHTDQRQAPLATGSRHGVSTAPANPTYAPAGRPSWWRQPAPAIPFKRPRTVYQQKGIVGAIVMVAITGFVLYRVYDAWIVPALGKVAKRTHGAHQTIWHTVDPNYTIICTQCGMPHGINLA